MHEPFFGMLISASVVLLFVLLFRHERMRGHRYCTYVRERVDFMILKLEHSIRTSCCTFTGGVLRQIFHYLFHTLVSGMLAFLKGVETALKDALRTNRTLARRSQRERMVHNKLDEIALHKIEIALSEEQKRVRREEHLNG